MDADGLVLQNRGISSQKPDQHISMSLESSNNSLVKLSLYDIKPEIKQWSEMHLKMLNVPKWPYYSFHMYDFT